MQLEIRFWDATQRRDAATVAELTAEDCIVVGVTGATILGPVTVGQMVASADRELRSYEIDPRSVRTVRVSDGTAIIAYRVREQISVDGEQVELDAYDSSAWHRRDGRWMCVLHTESIAGDPYGRDRIA
jgi:uncharacterized protein (TIGR02246 family)